jgi:hypothetical protein
VAENSTEKGESSASPPDEKLAENEGSWVEVVVEVERDRGGTIGVEGSFGRVNEESTMFSFAMDPGIGNTGNFAVKVVLPPDEKSPNVGISVGVDSFKEVDDERSGFWSRPAGGLVEETGVAIAAKSAPKEREN